MKVFGCYTMHFGFLHLQVVKNIKFGHNFDHNKSLGHWTRINRKLEVLYGAQTVLSLWLSQGISLETTEMEEKITNQTDKILKLD